MKKALSIIGKVFSFLGITLGMVFIALVLTITLICHGPSESAKELFATTILETGQLKFLANVFLSKDELQKIVDKNSLQDMDVEVDENLINTEGNKEKEFLSADCNESPKQEFIVPVKHIQKRCAYELRYRYFAKALRQIYPHEKM